MEGCQEGCCSGAEWTSALLSVQAFRADRAPNKAVRHIFFPCQVRWNDVLGGTSFCAMPVLWFQCVDERRNGAQCTVVSGPANVRKKPTLLLNV